MDPFDSSVRGFYRLSQKVKRFSKIISDSSFFVVFISIDSFRSIVFILKRVHVKYYNRYCCRISMKCMKHSSIPCRMAAADLKYLHNSYITYARNPLKNIHSVHNIYFSHRFSLIRIHTHTYICIILYICHIFKTRVRFSFGLCLSLLTAHSRPHNRPSPSGLLY